MRTPSPALKYVITIGITMLIGYASGMVTRDAIDTWYVTLNKPWFNPPNWIFGPVWSLLYIATVSYTHLDVYKRQTMGCCRPMTQWWWTVFAM